MRYRQILKKIVSTKTKMGDTMKGSAFTLTEAKYAAGDGIKHTVSDHVEAANVRVKAVVDNVAGVKIPKFQQIATGAESKMEMLGLGKGGQQIQSCRKSYILAVELLIELASLQTGDY
jgi:V-type H+-transporting ATPase subunit D